MYRSMSVSSAGPSILGAPGIVKYLFYIYKIASQYMHALWPKGWFSLPALKKKKKKNMKCNSNCSAKMHIRSHLT